MTATPLRGTALVPTLVPALLLLALVLGAAGCSRDDEAATAPAAPAATGSTTAAAPPPPAPVTTTARYGRVTGKLDKSRRASLRAGVTAVVDAWVDQAYLAGPWPRTDLTGAFPAFTRGAREDAERDARSLSNRPLGDRITGVTATKRALTIDVLAVRGRPAGVTARLVLAFDTTGARTAREVVRGDLYLTRRDGAWRVFGYDVTRGRRGGTR